VLDSGFEGSLLAGGDADIGDFEDHDGLRQCGPASVAPSAFDADAGLSQARTSSRRTT
jgi:hypothetical protein